MMSKKRYYMGLAGGVRRSGFTKRMRKWSVRRAERKDLDEWWRADWLRCHALRGPDRRRTVWAADNMRRIFLRGKMGERFRRRFAVPFSTSHWSFFFFSFSLAPAKRVDGADPDPIQITHHI